MNKLVVLLLSLLFLSCYRVDRNCIDFKNGKFEYQFTTDGDTIKGTIIRVNDLQIEYFNNKIDSSSVRWINDCEFVSKLLHPKYKSEEASINIKILNTTEDSYTFEYYIVGEKNKKQRGTAKKIN